PEEDAGAIEQAAKDLESFGTVAIGDVTNTLSAVHALARHGIGGIVFHEVFGLDGTKALSRFEVMKSDFAAFEAEWPTTDLAHAPAPHPVYTTHPDVIHTVMRAVRAEGKRTTIHLAEHPAERTYLMHGGGPYFDFGVRMRLPVDTFPVPKEGPVDYAARLG